MSVLTVRCISTSSLWRFVNAVRWAHTALALCGHSSTVHAQAAVTGCVFGRSDQPCAGLGWFKSFFIVFAMKVSRFLIVLERPVSIQKKLGVRSV